MMLKQSLVFWKELDKGESFPKGLLFLWDAGCDGDEFIAQLAWTVGGESWGDTCCASLGKMLSMSM